MATTNTRPTQEERSEGKSSYVTDAGYPEFNPLLPDIYKYSYNQVLAPEQSGYITSLDLTHNNPLHYPDIYTFIPALQRVLRLSAGAVCAPLLGSDQTNDDDCTNVGNCTQLPLFEAKILGEKKLLFMVHMKPEAANLVNGSSDQTGDINPFYWYSSDPDIKAFRWLAPKPTAGQFELRDTYVLAIRRLPTLRAGYCYGTRIYYIDKETWHSIGDDLWILRRSTGKPTITCSRRKLFQVPVTATSRPRGPHHDELSGLSCRLHGITHTTLNQNAGKYNDVTRYGTPAGLQQIMQ